MVILSFHAGPSEVWNHHPSEHTHRESPRPRENGYREEAS